MNKKAVHVTMSLLVLMAFSSVGYCAGLGQSDDELLLNAEQTLLLAQADEPVGPDGQPLSAECAAFARDPNADLREVNAAGCQPTLAQMSALMDNPLGNVAMLFTQFDVVVMETADGRQENKINYMGIAQFPKRLGKNWNLINRIVWNVPSMPLSQSKIDDAEDQYGSGEGPIVLPPGGSDALPIDLFSGRTSGFGDMYYNGLLAPSKGNKLENGASLLWGAGVCLGFPTATEDLLGTGKWMAGPSVLGVYMGPKWKIGALLQQYFSFAGSDLRDDVNLTNIQYFIYYAWNETTSIGCGPNIIANWEQTRGNRWTVPFGLGVSKTVQFGKLPVRLGAEVYYSLLMPDDVPGQLVNFRFYMIPAVPSYMFSWM
jgi:hypothetical protein